MIKTAPERCDLDDHTILEQTKQHHIERYKFAQKYVRPYNRILDICSGTGYGLNIMRSQYPLNTKGIGLEIDEESVFKAMEKYSYPEGPALKISPNVFKKCNVVKLISWRYIGKFDVIVMFEAIEHFLYEDGLKILGQIKKLLKVNGTFIISSPRDINDKYNVHHKSMWTFSELKNRVGSIFSGIELWGQDWDTGLIDRENVMNNDLYIGVCKKGGCS